MRNDFHESVFDRFCPVVFLQPLKLHNFVLVLVAISRHLPVNLDEEWE